MGRRSFALQTGIFITALTVGLVGSVLFLRGCHSDRVRYEVVADTPVSGLAPGSEVSYRGLSAGVVHSLRVDPARPRRLLVLIEVDREIPVTTATFATLQLRGVTGTRVLDLDTGDPAPRLATTEQRPGQIPLHPSLFDDLQGQMQQLAQNLAELTGPENRARVERILTNTESATARLDSVGQEVERSIKGVPALVAEGRTTAKRVGTLALSLDEAARSATRLTTSTQEELSRRTIPRLNTAFEQIGRASGSLERLSRELEANPRSLLLGLSPPPPGPGERGFRRHR